MESEKQSGFNMWGNWLLPIALIGGLIFLLNVDNGMGIGATQILSPLEEGLRKIVAYFASAAEAAAALVIGLAMLRTVWMYLKGIYRHTSNRLNFIKNIQIGFGRSLALGLEFAIASDILRTAVAPNRQQIVTLAAIVILRTLLTYFLEREISQMEQNSAADD
ncbi:MAG: DUF1622 domain-containing protein [Anaerolineaceae bacterium]|nr:DUF1622 domain-containing protein [Anaerolineaceae bacterium]